MFKILLFVIASAFISGVLSHQHHDYYYGPHGPDAPRAYLGNIDFKDLRFNFGTYSFDFPCMTPRGEPSYCVSLFSCPHLIKSLATFQPRAMDYFRESLCKACSVDDVMVCCGSPMEECDETTTTKPITRRPFPTFPPPFSRPPPAVVPDAIPDLGPKFDNNASNPITVEARRNYVRNNLVPSMKYCGQQHTDDRVYVGNETAIDEFPWITHHYLTESLEIDYKDPGWCTGALITNRYVLSSVYCADRTFRIRLGQYSTHEDTSCIEEYNIRECTDPIITQKLEKIKRSGNQSKGPHALALIRLERAVLFTEYIRPICLPIDGFKRPDNEKAVIFSGWGSSSEVKVLKQRHTFYLTNPEVCYNMEPDLRAMVKRAQINFFCIDSIGKNETSCICEHGGPIMYKNRHRWFVQGIIIKIMGTGKDVRCIESPIAGITIDNSVMNWVLDNIED